MRRSRSSLAVLSLLLCGSLALPQGRSERGLDAAFAAGLEAYEAGRFEEAAAAFGEAERAAGPQASLALLHNLALSALRAGDLDGAESAAQRLVALGGTRAAALGEFLLGNAAFERCRRIGALARAPEAEPFALDAAISQGERAREAWKRAALIGLDRPAARRNVERALLELRELGRLREAARARAREREGEDEAPEEEEPDDEPGEAVDELVPEATAETVELGEEEIRAILELLAAKEREKRALRSARRAERSADVERDW